jgi:GT2 family glycosyltransferase
MSRSSDQIARARVLAAELRKERHRTSELAHAYAVMERSKFGRLRSLAALVADALGMKTPPVAAYSGSRAEAFPPPTTIGDGREMKSDYAIWLEQHAPRTDDIETQRMLAQFLPYKPLFSIVMPVYETPRALLIEALDSVLAQSYPYWELCIADDNSPSSYVRTVLEEYARRDERVKVVFRETNGHISEASNSAIAAANGDYIGLVDHDDVLSPEALFQVALVLNELPETDMLYSDEDKIDVDGHRSQPYFKPDWAPETFLSKMYTSHFGVYRRSIVEEIGGFRGEFNGSQDYDLVLRFTERTDRIVHIPKVLYSWRIHPGSAAGSTDAKPYAYIAAQKALREAMHRRGEPGHVEHVPNCAGLYIPRFDLRRRGRVSIIIPSRDRGADLERCLRSLFLKSTYADFEVILVDNGTVERDALETIERWTRWDAERFRVVRREQPFNFSALINAGAAASHGEFLLLLNNDTEIITPDWIERMAEYAQRDGIGAVGVKLLFPDDTVQHAGIVVGLGGAAGHPLYTLDRFNNHYFGALVTANNYSAVTAACMMVRREVFESVGGFDEEFAVAYNDVDFCLRLRAAGLRNVYIPHVELYHFESASRGSDLDAERAERNLIEQEKLIERWKIRDTPDPYFNRNFALTDPCFAIATIPEQRLVFRDERHVRARADGVSAAFAPVG